ncbi:MAG: Molybdopterin molybdenumtransferase MoeA [Clostridia bacterium]|jgi:molybdopterin molybdotransferase|nr:Molybdopterin molybdenumtransferase MoeA [Clostridia bacterium]
MNFFNVLAVEEVDIILQKIASDYLAEEEIIDILQGRERIVSEAVFAPVDLPEFNRSTVDGYAVISQEVMGASSSMPSFLECSHEVVMGTEADLRVQKGQAVYVPTGGMVPAGADGMVMIEYVEKLDDKTILVHKPIAPLENMTLIGDDLKKGEIVIEKGKKLTSYDIGLLVGLGITKIKVYKKPRFAVISTGDEIVDLDEPQKIGQVRDINGYALSALITELGGQINKKVIVKDEFNWLQKVLKEALEEADIILISGGSSVGTRDYTKDVMTSLGGKVLVHGISIKPGKPTIVGQINEKIVFGLPGHPASALIVFDRFVKTYMQRTLRRCEKELSITAILESNVHASPGKETYQMVQLMRGEHDWRAVPFYAKSGMMTLLAKSSGYIRISNNQEGLMKGEKVEVFLFQEVMV